MADISSLYDLVGNGQIIKFIVLRRKIIFNYNWFYLDSRWTPDNKQLIFLTASCSIWWCDSTGVYMSQRDNFPSMNRVLSYEIQWCGFDECELSIEKLTNNNLIILVKKYDARGNPTIKFKRVTLWLSDWKIIKSQNSNFKIWKNFYSSLLQCFSLLLHLHLLWFRLFPTKNHLVCIFHFRGGEWFYHR